MLQPTTPINLIKLSAALHDHPQKQFTASLIHDLTHGADIGFSGNRAPRYTHNGQSAMIDPDAVTTAITKELRLGHTIGPFAVPPLPNFVVNSLGLIGLKNQAATA